jgi:hypothetical protein
MREQTGAGLGEAATFADGLRRDTDVSPDINNRGSPGVSVGDATPVRAGFS